MDKIIICNEEIFEKKIKNIKESGKDNLHLVSDFDNTLTKAYINGLKNDSAIAQIRKHNYLSEPYTSKSFELYNKYHAIEIDPHIPSNKKDKYMNKWWSEQLALQVEHGMNKTIVDDIVNSNFVEFRPQFPKLIKTLSECDIPLLILSAGIGDIITGLLDKHKLNYDNIHTISNFYDYDNNNKIRGYKGEIIHTFNKDESNITLLPHYTKIANRQNIILLGDNIGDLDMCKSLNSNTVLKIAFYNYRDNNLQRLEQYKNNYDMIILNDGSLAPVYKIIERIIK